MFKKFLFHLISKEMNKMRYKIIIKMSLENGMIFSKFSINQCNRSLIKLLKI